MKLIGRVMIHTRLAARVLFLIVFLGAVFLFDRVTLKGSAAVLPTRTPTRIPTRTPTPRAATISRTSLNKSTQADLIRELFLSGPAAGGDDELTCNRHLQVPYMVSSYRQEILLEALSVTSCGWMPDELVDVLFLYPNGKVARQQVTSYEKDGQYAATASIPTKWDDPTGVYHVVFTGSNDKLSGYINVFRPTAPRVIQLSDLNLLLYHFSPGEHVRLLIYRDCTTVDTEPLDCLEGWQALQVDRQGNLAIRLGSDLRDNKVAILGEKSGELEEYGFLYRGPYSYKMVKRNPSDSLLLRSSCPGAPQQRLKAGWAGSVCMQVDPVTLRQQPGLSGAEIVSVVPGSPFIVVDGPACVDNLSWWKVETLYKQDDGLYAADQTGWLAESYDSTDLYTLCPEH